MCLQLAANTTVELPFWLGLDLASVEDRYCLHSLLFREISLELISVLEQRPPGIRHAKTICI